MPARSMAPASDSGVIILVSRRLGHPMWPKVKTALWIKWMIRLRLVVSFILNRRCAMRHVATRSSGRGCPFRPRPRPRPRRSEARKPCPTEIGGRDCRLLTLSRIGNGGSVGLGRLPSPGIMARMRRVPKGRLHQGRVGRSGGIPTARWSTPASVPPDIAVHQPRALNSAGVILPSPFRSAAAKRASAPRRNSARSTLPSRLVSIFQNRADFSFCLASMRAGLPPS